MLTRLLLIISLFFLILIMVTSCEYEVIEFEDPDPTVEIKFSNDILPIFNNGCNVVGCHTLGHFSVDLTTENAYLDLIAKNLINTDEPAQSSLYSKLATPGSTHAGRSTPTEQQTILLWIEQGAKDN